MINPSHLRPGNWIYPTGRSRYVVVTGLLLGMMEKNEDLCKEFEGIELTGELLQRIGFNMEKGKHGYEYWYPNEDALWSIRKEGNGKWQFCIVVSDNSIMKFDPWLESLDNLQNVYFFNMGSELPLPESAKIIPEGVGK